MQLQEVTGSADFPLKVSPGLTKLHFYGFYSCQQIRKKAHCVVISLLTSFVPWQLRYSENYNLLSENYESLHANVG